MELIQSTKNERVKKWKKLMMKKGRMEQGTYLVEGFHLVEEALKQDGLVEEVIVEEGLSLDFEHTSEIRMHLVSREVSHYLSETKSEQGVFAVVKMTEPELLFLVDKKFLLLDAVQDPGNVGTLIRTADAAGFDAVILGTGSADLYNPKVIRSAQGSHFHIPVISGNLTDWLFRLIDEEVPVYGAFLDETAMPYDQIPKKESFGLVVGNEGNGISKPVEEKIRHKVYIPIFGESESLNVSVAAGILMYALRK
ncbi:TrmH family RNA methyltransferase [Listeria kieliensis]|uniref:RNA methyltransferase n=1 Tax=Listeria kieliensis TaxID=1621700 RepID=A0A3D8TUK3_9LIST|nr:RNA methyltransferase [Listeria kieliensis]RDX02555.1 RNA methyltransferase [Listeria kieliensis]